MINMRLVNDEFNKESIVWVRQGIDHNIRVEYNRQNKAFTYSEFWQLKDADEDAEWEETALTFDSIKNELPKFLLVRKQFQTLNTGDITKIRIS
jgi:hypothetical protein